MNVRPQQNSYTLGTRAGNANTSTIEDKFNLDSTTLPSWHISQSSDLSPIAIAQQSRGRSPYRGWNLLFLVVVTLIAAKLAGSYFPPPGGDQANAIGQDELGAESADPNASAVASGLPAEHPSGRTLDASGSTGLRPSSNNGLAAGIAALSAGTPAGSVPSVGNTPSRIVVRGERVADGVGLPQIPVFDKLSGLDKVEDGAFVVDTELGLKAKLSLKPDLQWKAEQLLQNYRVPYGALVALEPKTGRVLALASYSAANPGIGNLALRATFPAASLFKVVTTAALVEERGFRGTETIAYRGGLYTLGQGNYDINPKLDRRTMTVGDALARSVNPVFARIALGHLSPSILARYAESFGFNRRIPFELPLQQSTYTHPVGDYELARTAAGFGDVRISPLHAAMIAAMVGNQGRMMKPLLVDQVTARNGAMRLVTPEVIGASLLSGSAQRVLELMKSTVVSGTARRHFARFRRFAPAGLDVAGKTGTLSGKSPEGVYHWFAGVGPTSNPEIAVAALVIDPGNARLNGAALAGKFFEHYFAERLRMSPSDLRDPQPIVRPIRRAQISRTKDSKSGRRIVQLRTLRSKPLKHEVKIISSKPLRGATGLKAVSGLPAAKKPLVEKPAAASRSTSKAKPRSRKQR